MEEQESASSSATTDELFCRVCRGESTPTNPLRHPCKCRGSVKWIHADCLREWLSHSRKTECELCRHRYEFVRELEAGAPRVLPVSVILAAVAGKVSTALSLALRFVLVGLLRFVIQPCVIAWVTGFFIDSPLADWVQVHGFLTAVIGLSGIGLTVLIPVHLLLDVVPAEIAQQFPLIETIQRDAGITFDGNVSENVKLALCYWVVELATLGFFLLMPYSLGKFICPVGTSKAIVFGVGYGVSLIGLLVVLPSLFRSPEVQELLDDYIQPVFDVLAAVGKSTAFSFWVVGVLPFLGAAVADIFGSPLIEQVDMKAEALASPLSWVLS